MKLTSGSPEAGAPLPRRGFGWRSSHIDCVIPSGVPPDHQRWVHPKYPFFLPVKVLSRVFRGKFVDGLKRAYRQKKIRFSRANAALEDPKHFLRFLRTLFREDWVVYAKPAFGGAPQV